MSDARVLALILGLVLAAPSYAEEGSLGDPTRPTPLADAKVAGRESASGVRWRLHSTLVAEDRRLAVINGRTLRTGDSVDGAKLVDIRSDGVTLEYDRRRMELRLHSPTARVRTGGE